jgi:trimethylamine:corrinoid methyltransferase-like protein
MSTSHTRRNYRRHWYPEIISRDTYDTWLEKDETVAQICTRKAQEIVKTHEPPPLPDKVEQELERIMQRYLPGFNYESTT